MMATGMIAHESKDTEMCCTLVKSEQFNAERGKLVMWSGCTLQPLASGPKINYNEMLIKRQAYNE